MELYSLDKRAIVRACIAGDFEAVKRSVFKAGNTTFKHFDNDSLGLPIILCEIQPEDDPILGLVWHKHILEE